MEGKRKSCENEGQPETKQARSETTRTSDVSGQHSVEMDSAEIRKTGDLLEGTVSKGSQQRDHASDSTESSSSESELEREKERLLAEEKRLNRSHRKQQLRAEINELKASVEDKKVKKQSFTLGMDGKGKRSDNDKRSETEQARSDSLPEATKTSNVPSGEHSVEMDSAEIRETGDVLEGTVPKGSQRDHASDSTESSSSESELEREKERLLAEEKRLNRSHRKQLRSEINELKASVENKKVKKQSLTLGMDGKGKRSDNDKRPETEQARSDSLPETTRTSNVPSGEHSDEMDSAEICKTGDLLEGTVSRGSQQREHASDSTESSSSESELEREKERLHAEEKRLNRSHRKQQLRAEINELKASVENKKVKKQSFTLGMDGKSKRSDNDKRPETEQARLDSLPEASRTSNVTSVTGMSGGNAENCNICGQSIHVYIDQYSTLAKVSATFHFYHDCQPV